jgi:hypothetical protein
LAFTYEHGSKEQRTDTPLLDINYGLFDHVQLKLEVPWETVARDGHHPSGLGESIAGVKWRFLDEDTHGVAMSIYPQLQFHWPALATARRVRGDEQHWLLPIQIERPIGPITVGGEVGLDVARGEKPRSVYGLAMGHKFTGRFELLGEIHGTAGPQFRQQEWLANGGCRFNITRLMTLLASAGTPVHSFQRDPPKIFSYIALQFTF